MTSFHRTQAHTSRPRHFAPTRSVITCAIALASFFVPVAAQVVPPTEVLQATALVPRLIAAVLTPVQVPGTTPMAAAAVDLAAAGYTEHEFYATGQAYRYRGALRGALLTPTEN